MCVALPTHVGAWSMAVLLGQPFEYYYYCLTVFYSHSVYPGETIKLPVVIVGQDFGTGTGSVYALFLSSEGDNDKRLEDWQCTQGVSHDRCHQLEYTIPAAPTNSTVLVLCAVEVHRIVSNATVKNAVEEYHIFMNGSGPFPQDLLNFPLYIDIAVRPCPLGFTLLESPYMCQCSYHLRRLPE